MTIVLYYSPGSCSLAPHIVLNEIGEPFELRKFATAELANYSAEYLAVNPKGRVPALATDRGILTETTAMLVFIEQTFPQARLAPLADPFRFAQAQAFNSYLCATLHVAHSHRMRGARWANEAASFADMQRKVPESVAECFGLIEKRMLAGPWVMGEAYTICDPYLFTMAQWMEADGVDPARFPKVRDHRQRMSERPQVRAAIAEELN